MNCIGAKDGSDVNSDYDIVVWRCRRSAAKLDSIDRAVGARVDRACHADAMAEVVARTSWDATADAMAALVEQADAQRRDDAARSPAQVPAQSLNASSPWRTRAA